MSDVKNKEVTVIEVEIEQCVSCSGAQGDAASQEGEELVVVNFRSPEAELSVHDGFFQGFSVKFLSVMHNGQKRTIKSVNYANAEICESANGVLFQGGMGIQQMSSFPSPQDNKVFCYGRFLWHVGSVKVALHGTASVVLNPA